MKLPFLIVLIFLFSASAFANLEFKKESGVVEFKAKGWPSLLKINGKGEGFKGELISGEKGFSGRISFDLRSLKTGIEMRDGHLKNKYLKVEKNPRAFLDIVSLEIPKKGKLEFDAALILNGVSRKVNVSAKVVKRKGVFKVKADFKIKLSDFNIEIPSFKGVTVAEEVSIKVSSKVISVKL